MTENYCFQLDFKSHFEEIFFEVENLKMVAYLGNFGFSSGMGCFISRGIFIKKNLFLIGIAPARTLE